MSNQESGRQPFAPAKPASTIMLLRPSETDGAVEVFMVVRHHEIDFVPGALVFPGGKVDPEDVAPALLERSRGGEGLEPDRLALRIAAIREAYEESGVLLARLRGQDELLANEAVDALEAARAALNAGTLSFERFVVEADLELALDLLVPFAHWITPRHAPKRFDTHFFLAPVPSGQRAHHDGTESVASVWISPKRVLREADEGQWSVIIPTRCNLEKVARNETIEAMMEAARVEPIVTVEPWVERRGEERILCIPKDAGYAKTEHPSFIL